MTMQDRLKFRGMTLGGEWVYGNLAIINKKIKSCGMTIDAGYYISNKVGMPFAYPVRPETIGQCIGLKDKNGKLIYDNDFIRAINQDTKDRPDLQIGHIWVDEMGCRWIKFKTEELSWNDFCSLIDYDGTLTIEVIGNIHENADLIKVGGK